MQRYLSVSIRAVCGLLGVMFLVGLFVGQPLFSAGPWLASLGLLQGLLDVICVGVAVWACVAYTRADGKPRRLLFASAAAVSILMLISELIGRLQPQLAEPLRHPVDTVLAYLLAALVIIAVALDARARTQR